MPIKLNRTKLTKIQDFPTYERLKTLKVADCVVTIFNGSVVIIYELP